ncbi:flagellar basal body P-ring formation chaperone FlgA [Novosphingobium clariflavum]|uniref:Flagella basal body P-ring formation protein FlgA n=1 Tax=Novosphingobium clariflavum TaxID=2029884 RepID=A0ABV6SBC0_9SPHN|nr:flagellar basal body P-ring formation chaperone FlgA [Novosphingobium clariflavum]
MFAALVLALAAAAPAAAPDTVVTAVLDRTVERGERLSASDFSKAALPAVTARGTLTPAQAAGQEASRRLSAGAPVRAADVVPPRLVRRGEAVTISVASGTMRITSAGRALSDAAKGEPVRVLNLATSRTLDAVAEAPGQVSIPVQ